MTHSGQGNFIVYGFSAGGGQDLLVNEIGAYSGTVRLTDGTSLVSVQADGSWSITPQ
jgi:hypothetical protein